MSPNLYKIKGLLISDFSLTEPKRNLTNETTFILESTNGSSINAEEVVIGITRFYKKEGWEKSENAPLLFKLNGGSQELINVNCDKEELVITILQIK